MTAIANEIVTKPVTPLPRDIDVAITINRPQTEIKTDLSLLVFCTPNAKRLPPNNGRVILASTAQGIFDATGWGAKDTGSSAVQAWSAQSPRPQRMAVGRVFEDPVQPQCMAGVITDYTPFKDIEDGALSFDITDNDGNVATVNLANMAFAKAATLPVIVNVVSEAITAAGADSVLSVGIEYDNRLTFTALVGHQSISYGKPGADGTDISGLLHLTQATGAQKWDYYAPAGLVEEVKLVQRALEAAGAPAFVIALDKKYRDTPEQKEVADYAEANAFRLAATLCSNSPTAMDSADTTNICFYAWNKGYKATSTVYSSSEAEYPEIAYVQDTLSTNYALWRSTGTAKFKNGAGITPENISEFQLQVLESRNCNVFVRVGNTSRTFREGTQAADTWWTDSYYGVCNLREELQVAVFNLLLRRRKVPYDSVGVSMVVSVLTVVFERYVYNGFLSARQEMDESLDSPYVTRKPFRIEPTPIYLATESERASRRAPPFHCTAYEAGAMHKVDIFLDLVN